MIDGATEATLTRLIDRIDYFRRPPARVGGRGVFKEWMHFCVYSDSLDLLVNFSDVDDPRRGMAGSVGRMTVLARTDRWFGGVEEVPAEALRIEGGKVAASFGASSVRFEGGRYHLRVALAEHDIAAELTLRPITTPAPIHNVSVGDGPPIHWVVIPRLLTTGTVTLQGKVHHLEDAPAYHDHNWGHFGWGRDFAWEWGFGLPTAPSHPWSFVFARLSNRGRTRTRMQTLFLWRGAHAACAFRDAQIHVRHHGLLRPGHLHRVPPVMALLSPGGACDVPARMEIDARNHTDSVHVEFTPRDVAQVIIPNDDDLGVTIINEVAGEFALDASIRGEPVQIRCPTIFEFLGD